MDGGEVAHIDAVSVHGAIIVVTQVTATPDDLEVANEALADFSWMLWPGRRGPGPLEDRWRAPVPICGRWLTFGA
jgi:hypothetical protein